jgi:Na+/proline symporter
MGMNSYKTGALFFIISRLVGATARLYLVINILQTTILEQYHIPFWVSALIILAMIIAYTYEGGVKTIVWTDTLQTSCMLLGLIVCTVYILNNLHLNIGESFSALNEKGYMQIFNTDFNSSNFFIKQILAGAFITITMTGIDQEMMQKSISVKNLKDSQKNMVSLAFIMVVVIGLFLYLGGLLYLFAGRENIADSGDALFPAIALHHMTPFISVIFVIALISALFPSADGAMTALTSSFCIDILGINRKEKNNFPDWDDSKKKRIRQRVHLIVAFLFMVFILIFKKINDQSMIGIILKLAGYTYGPLLGLFAFGIFTKRKVKDAFVPVVCILSPVICFFIDKYQHLLFGNFQIGLELIVINGLLTFAGLWMISETEAEGRR